MRTKRPARRRVTARDVAALVKAAEETINLLCDLMPAAAAWANISGGKPTMWERACALEEALAPFKTHEPDTITAKSNHKPG